MTSHLILLICLHLSFQSSLLGISLPRIAHIHPPDNRTQRSGARYPRHTTYPALSHIHKPNSETWVSSSSTRVRPRHAQQTRPSTVIQSVSNCYRLGTQRHTKRSVTDRHNGRRYRASRCLLRSPLPPQSVTFSFLSTYTLHVCMINEPFRV